MYAEKKDYDDIEMSSRLRNILRRNGFSRLDDEINSVLNYIEETSYNAAQGYRCIRYCVINRLRERH